MTLPTQTEQQMINGMIASFASSTGIQPVFSSGDALLAFMQTVAVQLDFLQGLVQTVVLLTRAQTSTGADLDTWMAQFSFARLPATFAEAPVTFGANQPAANPVSIPAATLVGGIYTGGTVIQTSNGGTQYQVIPDTADSTYNPALNAYVLAIGQTSLTAEVQALTAGSAANVAANTLVAVATPLPGIDTVTNPAPISNGIDAESDASFRARFVLYLGSLAQATETAILAAANDVQQGLQISTIENQDPEGMTVPGSFTVFVDDGSGDPPTQLLDNVFAAVNAVRAFGIEPFVSGPNVTAATIVITIRLASGFLIGAVGPAVKNAIAVTANALLTGATLFVSAVEQAALTVQGCAAVQPGTTINGVNADLVPASNHEIRTTTGSITVSTY